MADGTMSLVDIGKRIVMLRTALDKNQGEFARLVGISQPALANYEAGFRRPEIDKATMIVNRTGVTLDWLYLGNRAGLPARLLEQLGAFEEAAGRRQGRV